MKIEINIRKGHFYFLAALTAVLIVAILAVAQVPNAPNPGHSADEVGAGTFFGDNYVFSDSITLGGVSRSSWPNFNSLDCSWYTLPSYANAPVGCKTNSLRTACNWAAPSSRVQCPDERPFLRGIDSRGAWIAESWGITNWELADGLYCCKIVP